MARSSYSSAGARLESIVRKDLTAALERRGADVEPDGPEGGHGVVIRSSAFCILTHAVSGSPSASADDYRRAWERRADVENEHGRPTHLLLARRHIVGELVQRVAQCNVHLEREGRTGRVLFLNLDDLDRVLRRLSETPAELYPMERWPLWFAMWRDVGSDTVALDRLCDTVLAGDDDFRKEAGRAIAERSRARYKALQTDLRRVEDALRQSGTTGYEALRCLASLVFVKWYEEMRELRGEPNRLTSEGFAVFRRSSPAHLESSRAGFTLRRLLDCEFGNDAELARAGLRESVAPLNLLRDGLLQEKVFPLLDRHRFRGTDSNALHAAFDATVRRRAKDARTGQFFTPEPIIRFAVSVVRPTLREVVLDPAAGAGFLLGCIREHTGWSSDVSDSPSGLGEGGPPAVGRILGCDTDAWIASIARMNLHMHGGSAGDVRVQNGLYLADLAVFGGPLLEAVDACITHPPLGSMSFRHAAEELVRRCSGDWASADEWLDARLPIIDKELEGDNARHGSADRRSGGTTAAAGALFISAISACLKSVSDPAAPVEWRGGRLGIVVDEAILNTTEHARTRAWVRQHYFVKAVFSFARDAFWYEARTTAKASLLYLVKKEVPGEIQREPTFFAQAERTGVDRTGDPDPSDLPALLEAYLGFEEAVRAGYGVQCFDERGVQRAITALELPAGVCVQWPEGISPSGARMDYAYAAGTSSQARWGPASHRLGDFVSSEVRHPVEDPSGCYAFATINRSTGEVHRLREDITRYRPSDLRVVRAGDVVVSGIDLVNGAAGYAYPEADGLVLSREFYTLALRAQCASAVDPRYLALLLRTPHFRDVVAGYVTGASGRTRIKGVDDLLALPIPPFPPMDAQQRIVADIERARAAHRDANAVTAHVRQAVNELWRAALR